jgi:hypothetical protein
MGFSSIFLGFIFVLSGIFIVHCIRNNSADKKLKRFSLSGYSKVKIYDKPCSTAIIFFKPPLPKSPLSFTECNLFITDDFIIVQGVDGLLLKTVVTQFVISKNNSPANGTEYFGRFNWLETVELNPNKTQVKLVYRIDYSWKPTYSLIISNLTPEEFDTLSVVKDWI